MSLLQLLSSGKTLIGLQPAPRRYQFSDPRSMPKFGSDKNPLKVLTRTEPPKVPVVEVSAKATQVLMDAIAGVERHDIDQGAIDPPIPALTVASKCESPMAAETSPVALASVAPAAVDEIRKSVDEFVTGPRQAESRNNARPPADADGEQGSGKSAAGPARLAKGSWFSEWTGKLSSLLPPRARPARSAVRPAPLPVQGEFCLSLDAVRPLRNDLSDTDFEVVPVQPGSPRIRANRIRTRVVPNALGTEKPASEAAGLDTVGNINVREIEAVGI